MTTPSRSHVTREVNGTNVYKRTKRGYEPVGRTLWQSTINETETGLLTNKVPLVLEIKLDLLLGVLERDESGRSFLGNSVEFRADASRCVTSGSYRAIGGVMGESGCPERGCPEGTHFL